MLRRAGCDVTVFERSSGELRDRGQGVGISGEVHAELVGEDLIDAGLPGQSTTERSLFAREGDSALGRLVWLQPFGLTIHNWGMLWANLRDRVPDSDYRDGVSVVHIEPADDAVTLHCDDGRVERFDVVLGADGYRSRTRRMVDPAARPEFAGYVLWRGAYPITELPQPVPGALRDQAVAIVYPGGHSLMMFIPDPQPPGSSVYWAVYYQPAQPLPHDADPVVGDLLPGLEALVTEHFPPYWAEVVLRTKRDTTVVHSILDVQSSRYTADRIALIGDAASVARPHTGSGAVKALQDALALGRLRCEHADWDTVLARYDEQRRPAGDALVELGRRLGEAQVTDTPPWTAMSPDDLAAWMRSVLEGRHVYFYDAER